MKKILIWLSFCGFAVFTFSVSKWEYMPTTTDETVIKNFQTKLDKINNEKLFRNLLNQISALMSKNSSPRVDYLLSQISDYLNLKLNSISLSWEDSKDQIKEKKVIKLEAKEPDKSSDKDRSKDEDGDKGYSCEVSKTTCSQMNSCKEAYFYLNSCGMSRLDRDKDWVPCETICG